VFQSFDFSTVQRSPSEQEEHELQLAEKKLHNMKIFSRYRELKNHAELRKSEDFLKE